MTSIPVLVAEFVALLLRLPLLGGITVGLFVFRELYDEIRSGVLRAALDLGLTLLGAVVTVLAAVRIAQVPPHI